MDAEKEIKRHRLPCGPTTVSIDGVCRRRLRDHFDALLDRLTKQTHPEGQDPEEGVDELDLQEVEAGKEQEETDEQKRERMLNEGKIKIDVKRELDAYEAQTASNPESEEEEEETDDEMKKRLIREGKLKADVKKVVQKYEDKIMPKPKPTATKPKSKTADHSETEEEELQGNSKLLQDRTGKIKKR